MTEPLQTIFARGDAQLDARTKRDHPALPFDDVKQLLPNQWVALQVTGLGHPRGGLVGRVFAHGNTREMVEGKLRQVREKYPAARCGIRFTGRSILPKGTIFV